MQSDSFLKTVRDQYEQYPYPPRDPKDDSDRLIEIELERLDLINFYCFAGKCNFQNSRILVAGGGTGDSTIFLAEQLKSTESVVVYLDISLASMEVVKKRAAIRQLTNIEWIHGSIMSISDYHLAPFDYISCTGVLHHLDNPQQGLLALKSVLKSSGAMGLMLYGTYGRAGVYQMQQLLRLVNQNETELPKKIENTKTLIAELPETNWFNHNQALINDHKNLGDSGLVDLLLHQQDTSYNIEQVYQLLDATHLNFIEFTNVKMRLAYQPSTYISDPVLLKKIGRLPTKEQHHIAELLAGAFKKHEFYVSNVPNAKASFYDMNNIPYFFPQATYPDFGESLANAIQARPNKILPLTHSSKFEFDINADQLNYLFFRHINGINSLGTIFESLRKEANKPEFSNEELATYFYPIFDQFRQLDWLLLKAK